MWIHSHEKQKTKTNKKKKRKKKRKKAAVTDNFNRCPRQASTTHDVLCDVTCRCLPFGC